jgi:AAA15 family ATPase/GTPase
MLVRFTVKNYKIFREQAELSMIANNYDKSRIQENVYECEDFNLKLLRSAVVYGANASGKSKLMEALQFMRLLVLQSSKSTQKGDPIQAEPFLFDSEASKLPSEFEVIFVYQNEMFRYGFEVNKQRVLSEWLYHRPKTKEVEIFYRENQQFTIHKKMFPVGDTLARDEMVRENALMLSAAAQFNSKLAGQVLDWFNGFRVISALENVGYRGYSMMSLENNDLKRKMLNLLSKADMGIQDMNLKSFDTDELINSGKLRNEPDKVIELIKDRKLRIASVDALHNVYDKNKKVVGKASLDLETEESSGTNQFFALSGPIIDVLEKGWVLAVDELDSKLHPNLVTRIVELFNDQNVNKNNAQLIFNTHDTNLLSTDLFRRDQIWFTEKDRYGAAKLYSLADFKARNDEQFERNYLKGRYGAVPVVQDLNPYYKSEIDYHES